MLKEITQGVPFVTELLQVFGKITKKDFDLLPQETRIEYIHTSKKKVRTLMRGHNFQSGRYMAT